MKKFVILLSISLLLMSCANCTEKNEEKNENVIDQTSTNAIKVIKVNQKCTRFAYEIIEFEGHMYLSSYDCGLLHLESCPCKK